MPKKKRFRKVVQWDVSEQANLYGSFAIAFLLIVIIELITLYASITIAGDTGLPWLVTFLFAITLIFMVNAFVKLSEKIKRKVWWEEI